VLLWMLALVLGAAASSAALADDEREIRINDATVAEGGIARFTISLSRASRRTVRVKASTADGSATASYDYVGRRDVTISFAPGTTSVAFDVITLADAQNEGSETFTVNLRDADNADIGRRRACRSATPRPPRAAPPPSPSRCRPRPARR
jgi:Calx-beta domain